MAKKRYIELEGNPVFTDRKIVGNIEQNFLRIARKNPEITWVIREQGFGKEQANQWAQAREDVYVVGATKTKDDYYERKAKGDLPVAKPQQAVPRTSAGATFYHAGKRENQRLIREIKASGLSEAEKGAEWQKRSIKFHVESVKPSDIKYFQTQGEGKKSFKLAAELRDKRIKNLDAGTVRITQLGEFEGRSEYNARMFYEDIQEGRKAAKPDYLAKVARYGDKLVPINIKITDDFIDKVNARQFKSLTEERAFKAGALKFLQNKETYQQIQTPEAKIFTPQRLEDTRSWHSGSLINPLPQDVFSLPEYKQVPGQVETEFIGQTPVTAETVTGPETPETVTLASSSSQQDYAAAIDEELTMSGSSFENMLPDEPTADFNYEVEDKPVPVQITTSAQELQLSKEPTIHKTIPFRTSSEVTLIHADKDSGKWSDEAHARVGEQIIETPTGITSAYRVPNRIYYSAHVDFGITAADLKLKATDPVQYAKVTARPGASPPDVSTLITSSISRVVNMGVPVEGAIETDAVQSYLQGDAYTEEGEVGQQGIKPTIHKGPPGLLESFKEGTAMIDIEKAAETGFKGKSILTSAYPEQFAGQTSTFTSKINERLIPTPGGEKGYKMTAEDIARQQNLAKLDKIQEGAKTPDMIGRLDRQSAMIYYGQQLEQKKAEFYARKEAGTQESFIQDIKDRKTGIRVISGGQIGADLIGLELAKELGFRTGGTAPKGFQTSTGANLNLSKTFNLTEVSDKAVSQYTGNEKVYGPRTEQNVLKSDVTFLFTIPKKRNSPGSILTRKLAKQHGKLLLENPTPKQVQSLIAKKGSDIIVNIAGNREFNNKAAIRLALLALSPKADAAHRIALSEEAFGPRGKPVTTNIVDDVDTWQGVEPAPKPAVVPVPKSAINAKEAIARIHGPRRTWLTAEDDMKTNIAIAEAEKAALNRPTRQQLIDSGEVPPDYFDEKYMGKGGRHTKQTEFQREDQSRALEKWRKESGLTDWRGNVIKKSPELKIPQFKSGDVLKYTQGAPGTTQQNQFEIVVSKGENIKGVNIVYYKAESVGGTGWSSAEVITGRKLFNAATRKEVMAQTQKYLSDPKAASSVLETIKEIRARNVKAGIGPTGETIELFKSRTTGEFTTKAGVRKEGVKALAGKVKPAGTTMINALGAITLMSPLIGAYGALKKTNIEEAEAKSAYPLYNVKPRGITAEDYGQSLWHRLAPQVFRSVKEQRKWDKKFPIPGDA